MINVNNWDERKQRYEEYWTLKNKTPILFVTAPKNGGNYDYEKPTPETYWFDPSWNIGANRHGYENTYYGGDSYPYVSPTLGPDILSAFLGLDIIFNETSTWVKHRDVELKEFRDFTLQKDNFYFKKMEEFLNAYAEDARNQDYIVGMVDLNTLLDGVASLIGPERLCLEMYDNPEEVKRVTHEHLKFYKQVFSHYNDIVTRYQKGNTNWLSVYSDIPWYYISNDFMVMVSGDFFDEFIDAPLREMVNFHERTLFHLDGENAVVHLDKLLKIDNLTGIQVQATPFVHSAEMWIPHLKKIQAAGKCTWIEARHREDVKELIGSLDPEGLFIRIWVDTEEEAKEIERMVLNYYK